MKYIGFLLFVFVFAGCRQMSIEDLQHLNGYWEISYVRFPDGTKKDFKINETVDFFKVDGNSGIRRKMKPQFDGTYADYGGIEKFEAVFDDGKAFLKYTAEFHSWTEEILTLNSEEFRVRNDSDIEYFYKRAVPFNIK